MSNKKIRSVLVIDDDRDDFDIVAEVIHDVDPDIGVSYLDRCEKVLPFTDGEFDLVLLDVNMPAYDGFMCLKDLRESGHRLPVVMYTNSNSPLHIAKAYDEGATLYFTKPESYAGLQRSIRKLLDLDWSNPDAIKRTYTQNGRYATFRVA